MGISGVPLESELIIDGIKKANGVITRAAKIIGCSVWAIYQRARVDEDVALAIKETRKAITEEIVETAEAALLGKIQGGDSTCIIFALKTQGKEHGYEQKEEGRDRPTQILVNVPQSDEKPPSKEASKE